MPLPGKGKVLIMDDEEIIRLVTGNMLSHVGYRVMLAKNGEEAVDAYKKGMENGDPFDIVILDLTVRGGMGGSDAIRRLREIDPGVRAIVSSGYSRDPVMLNHAQYGFSGVLPKPYKVQELFDAIRSAMTKRDEPGAPSSEAQEGMSE
jgi:two-component system cell cycle sensor histidine kinase/response regulator CckA